MKKKLGLTINENWLLKLITHFTHIFGNLSTMVWNRTHDLNVTTLTSEEICVNKLSSHELYFFQ